MELFRIGKYYVIYNEINHMGYNMSEFDSFDSACDYMYEYYYNHRFDIGYMWLLSCNESGIQVNTEVFAFIKRNLKK